MPGFDLHTHTTFSDGTTTPERNVELAIEAGLDGIGVTDHDTAASWERARAAADGTSLEIIPGVELSAEHEGYSVHVLGYWIDPDHPPLAREMDRLGNERERRAEEIVAKFNALDVPVSMERVRQLAGTAPIGRPHIATAVVETGAAEDNRQVFDTWLRDGGPAYVPKYAVDPLACVRLIRDAGGVAVLAHPGLYGPAGEGPDVASRGEGLALELIEEMIGAGLDGIEADHPDHEDDERRRYGDLARAHGLVVTAGSDFHGGRKDLQIGEATTTREALEALRDRLP